MLLKLRQLVSRSAALKSLAGRLMRYAPGFDRWLRAAIARRLYKPSALQVKAGELPEIAEATYHRLHAEIRKRQP